VIEQGTRCWKDDLMMVVGRKHGRKLLFADSFGCRYGDAFGERGRGNAACVHEAPEDVHESRMSAPVSCDPHGICMSKV
jgi:hypothetical protein